jgi:hypothetical protein
MEWISVEDSSPPNKDIFLADWVTGKTVLCFRKEETFWIGCFDGNIPSWNLIDPNTWSLIKMWKPVLEKQVDNK